MASSSRASLIPTGYTFMNPKIMVSKKAEDMIRTLMEKLDKRDPDAFGLYIYNDFFNYAQLDLVDHELSSIHAKIQRKEWSEAFYQLEALTVWTDLAALSWPMADDGDRSILTDKVYGACLVKVLVSLEAEKLLSIDHFPNLETVLRLASEWAEAFPEPGLYRKVINGIGKRLFGNKSTTVKELEKARVDEWISTLSENDQKELREVMKEQEEDADEDMVDDETFWGTIKDDEADENVDDDELSLYKIWKEYKEYLLECPTKPFRGPPQWDLTKWSQEDKAPFSYEAMDDD
ncbi:hypothetical protein ABKN59_005765 [Abortiporus biennis]